MYGQSQFSPEMQQATTDQLGQLDSRMLQLPQFSNLSNALMNGGYDFNPAAVANIPGAGQVNAQMVGNAPQGTAAQAAFGTASPTMQSNTALASYMGAPNQAAMVGPQANQYASLISPFNSITNATTGPAARTNPNMVAGVRNANAAQIGSQNVDAAGAFSALGGANPMAALQQNLSGGVNMSALEPVVQSAMRRMTENFNENVLPGINQGATAAGQYGSSRQGVAQGIAAKGLANAMSDTSASMYNQAFQQAEQNRANTANNLSSLGLSSAQQNAGRDLAAQQTNASSLNNMAQFNLGNEFQRQMANAAAGNQSDQFNAGAANDFAQFNAANQNNTNQFNASNALDTNKFNAANQNNFTQFNAGNEFNRQMANASATNNMNQFNLGNQLDLSKFNAGALNDTSRMNTAAQNDFSQFNMANALANHQFNANSQNNMNQFNLGNQFQALRDNAAATNNMGQFNTRNALDTQQFNAGLGFQNNQQGMQANQFNMNNRLQGLDVLGAGNNMQDNAYNQRMGLLNAPNAFNWGNLNNYSSIIQPGANVGGSQTSSQPYTTNRGANALGGALAGAQIAGLAGQSAGWGSLLGGLAMLSDRRMKTDISAVGKMENGLTVYRYRYKSGGPAMLGVMADEVRQVNPDAVTNVDGIDYVRYDQL
jgi:hypothetical protein